MTTRLAVGDPAPDFALADDAGRTVSLGDYAGRKVVVYFYPTAMTPGCTWTPSQITSRATSGHSSAATTGPGLR